VQVRAWSRNWSVLSTGGVLIDAPGVHDDNSARDAVVKRKLKDADAVWIVSNIVRAVNDKTAKDMLGEHFRRQLLMDGQFGALAFIATQSDVLDRSEAVRSLRLPAGTTLRECADARNQYAVQRLKQDFGAGLREMAAQAGSADADALVSRFDLPVFTVSAMDYQKIQGLRPADGAPRVWATAEQTLIPRLARHVRRAALVRRKALSLRRCRAMEDFTRGVVGLLEAESRLPAAVRDAAADAYQTREKELRKELRAACAEAEAAVRNDFETLVEPQLKAGANTATTEALRTAEAWPGQMHWATYKATTRRMGVFRLNMNEELTAPILKAVSVQWEQAFLSGLQRTLNKLQVSVDANVCSPNHRASSQLMLTLALTPHAWACGPKPHPYPHPQSSSTPTPTPFADVRRRLPSIHTPQSHLPTLPCPHPIPCKRTPGPPSFLFPPLSSFLRSQHHSHLQHPSTPFRNAPRPTSRAFTLLFSPLSPPPAFHLPPPPPSPPSAPKPS
jgi:hypothetical protein